MNSAPAVGSLSSAPAELPARRRGKLRVVAGWLLVPVAVLLAVLAGVAAALGTAALVPQAPVFLGVGALAVLAVGYGLGRLAGVLVRARYGRRLAVVLALGTAVGTAAVLATTVLTPLPAPVGLVGDPRGPGEVWQLPTGSEIVYDRVAAVGPARATPVLLLHGGPGTPGSGPGSTGDALAAQGFDVYAYDQVGAGRSERLADPREYTVARHVADLEAVREQIGAEQVVLVGTSWGAVLAAEYLAARPERVARVVLLAPGPLYDPARADRDRSDQWDGLSPERRAAADALLEHPRVIAWSLLQQVDPRAAHALVPDAELDGRLTEVLRELAAAGVGTCAPHPAMEYRAGTPGFYVNQVTAADLLVRPDPRPALRDLAVPALVLRGECDWIAPDVAAEYVDLLGAAFLEVPGAGHLVRARQPTFVDAALVEFLTR